MRRTAIYARMKHTLQLPSKQRGWGASEYLSVLMGLMVVWWGAQQCLAMVQEHHDEFTWALMIPY
jgi:hypothetical protein